MSALTKEQIEMLPMMIEEIRAVLPSAGERTKPFIEILDDLFGTVIEQQAEIERLREALAPVADLAEAYDPEDGDDDQYCWVTEFTPKLRDLRRARAALAVKP